MKFNKGLALLVLSFLVGCQSSPSKESEVQNKSVSEPFVAPVDNESHFYGVGFGLNELEAQNDALSKIATRISTSVISNTNSSQSVIFKDGSESIDRSFQKKINTQTKKINFSNIQVVKKGRIDDGLQLLVSVSRKSLINNYSKKINGVEFELKQDFKSFEEASSFQKLLGENALLNKLAELESLVQTMLVLNNKFNASSSVSLAEEIYRKIKSNKQAVRFNIQSDKNSEPFTRLLSSKLAFEGFAVIDSVRSSSSDVIRVNVKTSVSPFKFKTTNPQYANLKMVNRDTTFQVEDGGKVYPGRTIKTRGISSKSEEMAIQDSKAYEKLLNNRSVIDFLAN